MDSIIATRHDVNYGFLTRLIKRVSKTSLAERTSTRYIVSLSIVIVLLVLMQLYVWARTTLSKQIDELSASNKMQFVTLSNTFFALSVAAAATNADGHPMTPEQGKIGNGVSADSLNLNADIDKMLYESYLLAHISVPFYPTYVDTNYVGPNPNDTGLWFKAFRDVEGRMSSSQAVASYVQQTANLAVGIIGSYVLPVLFGTLGAMAYVLRTISDQIRNTTFSQSSPIRHFMRVTLGAVMGAVIGLFSGSTNQLTLPPLALAFLAGYGVEGVRRICPYLGRRKGRCAG
jgi:uncharacterized membrane protein